MRRQRIADQTITATRIGGARFTFEGLRQGYDYTRRGPADDRSPQQIVADARAVLVARDPELAAIAAELAGQDAGE